MAEAREGAVTVRQLPEGAFLKPCPECGATVVARYAQSSDGLRFVPWMFQVRRGPEHERSCKYWQKESVGCRTSN